MADILQQDRWTRKKQQICFIKILGDTEGFINTQRPEESLLAYTYHPCTQDAEAGELPWVWGQGSP